MTSLPIDTLREKFLVQLAKNHLIVEAETGSGKSTRLPIWASEQGRVLVIEPRRIACTSLAQYLAQQRNEPVGQSIGYAIKLETRFNETSEVVFVTPGVALRWYSENQLADYDIVVVDEFHERRWDTDLLVALLKKPSKASSGGDISNH
ncbi:RNA helicase [Vibrio scophthalmi]|nr:RNA helicase [Vibrio scophthalmi]